MNISFLGSSQTSLAGKTVVLTGAAGGLGSSLCRYLLACGAEIIMINRNREKSEVLCSALRREYKGARVSYLLCDLEKMDQVKETAAALKQRSVDILILNAGTYAIPRGLSSAGYDTVFQVNFLSQYYLMKTLLPQLKAVSGKVVVTGSIAHRFNVLDPEDPDFSHHTGDNSIYGNSKRFLMFAPMELLKNSGVSFAIGHPGISYTGITSHYPPEALAVVKPSMQLLVPHPEQACLSMVRASFAEVPFDHWIGPGYFDVWGDPVISPLHSCSSLERRKLFKIAEEMFRGL